MVAPGPLSKNVAKQLPLKNAAKHAPPKNATKQLPPKNAAKKAASKYAVNAALLKNVVKQLSRRCHVMSKYPSQKTSKQPPPLDKCCKAAPLKKYHKAATTKCFTAAPLEILLQAPPDIETITVYEARKIVRRALFGGLFVEHLCIKPTNKSFNKSTA